MSYVFPPAPVVSVPVVGSGERFPVHRISVSYTHLTLPTTPYV